MKKAFLLILVALWATVGAATAKEKGGLEIGRVPDGVYLGKSGGITGVKVEVEVKEGKITRIEVLKARGHPRYKGRAVKEVPRRIIQAQSLKVDAVTGATKSSKDIIQAVRNALPKE